MWIKSENGTAVRPPETETFPGGVMVRRNFRFVEASGTPEDEAYVPAHWCYEEWQMTSDQYEVYEVQQADVDFLTMENDWLTEENEQQQADIDFCLMMLEE